MRKTKRYHKRKNKRTRSRISKKVTKRITRKMKGGTLTPFSDIADAFSSIKYNIGNAIGIGMADPVKVAPEVKGGDNPLPYKQMGADEDINNYTNSVLASTQTSSSNLPSIRAS
jgi:hypothetical protein